MCGTPRYSSSWFTDSSWALIGERPLAGACWCTSVSFFRFTDSSWALIGDRPFWLVHVDVIGRLMKCARWPAARSPHEL